MFASASRVVADENRYVDICVCFNYNAIFLINVTDLGHDTKT